MRTKKTAKGWSNKWAQTKHPTRNNSKLQKVVQHVTSTSDTSKTTTWQLQQIKKHLTRLMQKKTKTAKQQHVNCKTKKANCKTTTCQLQNKHANQIANQQHVNCKNKTKKHISKPKRKWYVHKSSKCITMSRQKTNNAKTHRLTIDSIDAIQLHFKETKKNTLTHTHTI